MMTHKIRCNPRVLTQWLFDEEASWCDDGCPEDAVHVYPILRRHARVLEIRSEEEALLVIESGNYHGDLSGWDDLRERGRFRLAVKRITQAVKDHAAEESTKESK